MKMKTNAPIQSPPLRNSMHKTFADCYRMHGFIGGGWGYAANTNCIEGESIAVAKGSRFDAQQRRLGIYLLGWESIEVCLST